MNEEELVAHLLTLPTEVREHLVATYNDAATLFRETVDFSHGGSAIVAIERQHASYVRIATALLNSLTQVE